MPRSVRRGLTQYDGTAQIKAFYVLVSGSRVKQSASDCKSPRLQREDSEWTRFAGLRSATSAERVRARPLGTASRLFLYVEPTGPDGSATSSAANVAGVRAIEGELGAAAAPVAGPRRA